MYHDYIRTFKLRKIVITLSVAAFCVIAYGFTQHSNALQNEPVPGVESAEIVNEQNSPPSIGISNLGGDTTVNALPSPSNLLLETESINSASSLDDTADECFENVETPERANSLYCFIENGIRTDVPVEYQDYLYDLLKQYGCEDKYELMLALIYHESMWKSNIISRTNDYGLMQINKCNHKWLKQELGITDFLDPYQSMQAGVHIISMFFEKYTSAEQALVCYNMGEGGALKKKITSSEYSRGILADMEFLVELENC